MIFFNAFSHVNVVYCFNRSLILIILIHTMWMWIPILGRYHPDKNATNPEASELFKEVAYSYSILSDPEKKRQYDSAGFEVLFSLYSILFSAKFCGVCACVCTCACVKILAGRSNFNYNKFRNNYIFHSLWWLLISFKLSVC